MNIERIQQDLLRLYGPTKNTRGSQGAAGAGGADEGSAASRGDDVVLSEGASALRTALGVVKNAPDVRQQVVSALRGQVRDGTYQYQDEAVAQKLLGLATGE